MQLQHYQQLKYNIIQMNSSFKKYEDLEVEKKKEILGKKY